MFFSTKRSKHQLSLRSSQFSLSPSRIFSKFSDFRPARILFLNKPSHWIAGVRLRHTCVLSLADVHVNLRCPRVHFHSACLRLEKTATFHGDRDQGRPSRDKTCRTYTDPGGLLHLQQEVRSINPLKAQLPDGSVLRQLRW